MSGGNLWKPVSDTRGTAVFLAESGFADSGENVWLVDADTGAVKAVGTYSGTANGNRRHYRFDASGSRYGGNFLIVDATGHYIYISNGGNRVDGAEVGVGSVRRTEDGADVTGVVKTQTGAVSLADSESNVPGIAGFKGVAKPELIDPALNTQASITDTEFEFTDPITTLREIAKENKGQMDENFITALEQAGKLSESESQQLKDYLQVMSPVEQELIASENKFNQQQKLQSAETAMPGIQNILNGEIKNAQTLASGKLLTSSEDLALEQIARSAGADAAWTRGLGDDSLVGRTLSDQLSVSQRQALMTQGQNYLNTATTLAANVLMDTPNKAKLSQGIPSTPQTSLSDLTNQQQSRLDTATTMSPEAAQNSIVGQREYQSTMDFNTKVKNADYQETYTNRAIEIASANAAAMNGYNQAILNYDAQESSAKNKTDQYNIIEWMLSNGYISNSTAERLASVVDAGGTINPEQYHEGATQQYMESRGIATPSSVLVDSTTEGARPTNETPIPVDTRSAVTYEKSTYKTGYDKTKIVQEDGSITIPTYNYNFVNPANSSVLSRASSLTPQDLDGILK